MLKRLFTELRRRRVPQVAGFYLAAGWIMFEVAEGIFPRLGLPDWTITFVLVLLLLAFPLVVGLAWLYDIGPEGVRRTRPAGEEGEPPADALATVASSASTAAFGKIAVTGAVLVLALAGGAFVLFGDDEATPEVAADAMVVLPFTVRGGEDVSVLAEGMVGLLSAKLDGVGDLRSADPHVVLSLTGGSGSTAVEGRALADRLDAAYYVLGSVLEFGGQLRLQASIYETDGRESPVAEASVEGAADSFLALVDDLAAELLVAGDFAPPGRLPRIAALTTDDLEALRFFLKGERLLLETRYGEAITQLERAVEADSAFALAWYRMSVAASWSERSALRNRTMAAAWRHRDRLGERDRALVAAWVAAKEGRHAEAEDRYREILASHPDDLEAWYELGEVVLHKGAFLGDPPSEAEPLFRRALELDPGHGAALYHLSNIAAWEWDLPLVDSTTRALRDARGGDPNVAIEAQWAFAMEDSAGMEWTLATIREGKEPAAAFAAVFAAWGARDVSAIREIVDAVEAAADPDPVPNWQAEGLANEWAGRGARTAAVAWLDSMETRDDGVPDRTAVLATHPYLRVPAETLERLRARLETWDPGAIRLEPLRPEEYETHDAFLPHLRLYLLGLLEARLGRSGGALRLAEDLRQLDGLPEVRTLAADLALHVRAQVAMDQGLMAEALRLIEASSFWEASPWDERFSAVLYHSGAVTLRADALQALGRYREAIRWHGTVALAPDRAYSLYRQAQAYEALGESEQAAEHYARFLELWADADPDLRDRVEDARRRLQALSGEG